jgi:hypothetical protein
LEKFKKDEKKWFEIIRGFGNFYEKD